MEPEARRRHLSGILRPIAPPREIPNVYTEDQRRRLLSVVHDKGEWPLIIAQHFASAEELIATLSGAMPFGIEPKLDMFMTPTFRGFLANYSAVLYPELHDCFYNAAFLEQAKSYWGAQYAKPQMMLFNINGPCANCDPGHLDTPSFRGVRYESAPTWLCSVMGKSGLFKDYLIKMAQVVTWFSHDPTSGFTYWPDGPINPPQRIQPPIYNRGVVVQNEMMLHRGEANGPLDQQFLDGLTFHSKFTGDPSDADSWIVKADGKIIARYKTDDLRFLVHWSAEVFEDFAELKKNMDHSADLSLDQVFETLIKDVRAKGIAIDPPSDPLHDPSFIKTLNEAYDFGGVEAYPMEAFPSPLRMNAAQAAE
jgi:hypothetical protein